MLNPIKRVWTPKSPPAEPVSQAAAPVATPTPSPDSSSLAEPTPSKRGMLFDELPEPEVSEKFSDSVWAEFGSQIPQVK